MLLRCSGDTVWGSDGVLIVDLANQKGGVGTTTTTVNLARAAHLAGLPTLVVDLDPQANTTGALLGAVPHTATLADVLSARSGATAAEAIAETGWPGVDVLPSGGDTLAEVASELVVMPTGREYRLRRALDRLRADLAAERRTPYALVLLDSPPSLDQLTINGLTAADRVLVVTGAAQFSANGIARLLRTVSGVREYTNPALELAGIVVNAFEPNTIRGRHWMTELTDRAPAPVWHPPIPKATWIGGAIEAGLGLDEWDTPAATVVAETYDGYLRRLVGDRP